jgi:hypothetical protein
MRSKSPAARSGEAFARRIIVPALEFLCAIGSYVAVFAGTQGRMRLNGALGLGVSPASNLTTNLPQSTVTTYDKVFIENLKGNTPWVRATSRRSIDANSGNQLQLFMYQNLAPPPITTAPEGTIQTGLTVTVLQNISVMGQYADYMNISDYALGTAIDPTLEALGVQMSYRLAQVINTILQNTADSASTVDPLVDNLSKDGVTPLTNTDITAAVQSLAGVNALPQANGSYFGITHPFSVGDILIDKTNNSLTDVVKRTAEGIELLRELPSPSGDRIPVIDWGGVTFFQSTYVKQTPNYKGGGGTALRTYIVGNDGVIGVSFGGRDHTQIGEGNWRNLQVWVRRLSEPSGYDPSRMIGGFASYNAMYTATLPPDPVQRIRYIDAVSAIA